MSSEKRERSAAGYRLLEEYYRSIGEYESAVQQQQHADAAEATGGCPSTASWFQRGRDRFPGYGLDNDLLRIWLPNGMRYLVTKDVALDLWAHLTQFLGLTGLDLRAAARELDELEVQTTYDEEVFTKEEV